MDNTNDSQTCLKRAHTWVLSKPRNFQVFAPGSWFSRSGIRSKIQIFNKHWTNTRQIREVHTLYWHCLISTSLTYPLVERLASFFCKGPDSKHFRLCKPYSFCYKYSVLPLQFESSQRQPVNKWVWLCSNKILWTLKSEFHVTSMCSSHSLRG